jgi:IS4 transposase
LQFTTIKENELPENHHHQIIKDEIIELKKAPSKLKYPNKLRRVSVWNDENGQVIELITNQFQWSPNTISELYKSRWQVEIFFRDIKQLLHIKSFIGTSENAVMIQIWTALISILIIKAQSKFDWYLSNLVAFIRLNLFVKIDLQKWLNKPFEEHIELPPDYSQRVLF